MGGIPPSPHRVGKDTMTQPLRKQPQRGHRSREARQTRSSRRAYIYRALALRCICAACMQYPSPVYCILYIACMMILHVCSIHLLGRPCRLVCPAHPSPRLRGSDLGRPGTFLGCMALLSGAGDVSSLTLCLSDRRCLLRASPSSQPPCPDPDRSTSPAPSAIVEMADRTCGVGGPKQQCHQTCALASWALVSSFDQ